MNKDLSKYIQKFVIHLLPDKTYFDVNVTLSKGIYYITLKFQSTKSFLPQNGVSITIINNKVQAFFKCKVRVLFF